MKRIALLAAVLGLGSVFHSAASAQSATAFTYQGRLVQDGAPAEGTYEFEIRLLDEMGVQVGDTATPIAMVSGGAFTIDLDFGPGAFDGQPRLLEIGVRDMMDAGPYTILSPNTPVTSTPVAQFALAGNEGPQGPAGPQGPQGPQGDPGTTSWTGLTNIPAGFADNIDNDTTYAGGTGVNISGQVVSLASNPNSLALVTGGLAEISGGMIGLNTPPSDVLHINATLNDSALRVQRNGTTRLRVNANGGISLGANNTTVAGGDVYVAQSLGIRESTPENLLHIEALNSVADGLLLTSGAVNTTIAPAKLTTNTSYTLDSSTNILIDAGLDFVVSAADSIDLGAASRVDLAAGGVMNIDAGTIDIDSSSSVFIEGTTFTGNDVTVADDLSVNNDITVSSQATIGGPKAFDFTINCYGNAGKPGGGLWAVFSDARLKENITPLAGSLDALDALRPVTFNYKKEDHFSYVEGTVPGFVAQDVRQVLPRWVERGDDGYLYLNPVGYEAMVVDAIQELRAEKDAQIEAIQAENDALRARLDRLEALLSTPSR